MGFGSKILLSLMLATIYIGAGFAINYADAKSENDTAQSTNHSKDQEIHELSKKVSELNKRLDEVGHRSSKEEEITDLNKKVSELKDAIVDSKKMSFDTTSTVLNILIAFSAFVITGVGLAFGVLAFLGVKGFGEIKKEVNEQLTSTSEKIDDRLSSKYKETVEEYFQAQGSAIREEFSNGLRELEERIDECCGKAGAATQAKDVPPAAQQTPSGNAFDDVKS